MSSLAARTCTCVCSLQLDESENYLSSACVAYMTCTKSCKVEFWKPALAPLLPKHLTLTTLRYPDVNP